MWHCGLETRPIGYNAIESGILSQKVKDLRHSYPNVLIRYGRKWDTVDIVFKNTYGTNKKWSFNHFYAINRKK